MSQQEINVLIVFGFLVLASIATIVYYARQK